MRQQPDGTLVADRPFENEVVELALTDATRAVVDARTALRDRNRHPLSDARISLGMHRAERLADVLVLALTPDTAHDSPIVDHARGQRDLVDRAHENEPGPDMIPLSIELHERGLAIHRAYADDPHEIRTHEDLIAWGKEQADKATAP